jgi:hypothetical protein
VNSLLKWAVQYIRVQSLLIGFSRASCDQLGCDESRVSGGLSSQSAEKVQRNLCMRSYVGSTHAATGAAQSKR